jgi:hypothetical protein
VPQLTGGVADDPIGVGSGIALENSRVPGAAAPDPASMGSPPLFSTTLRPARTRQDLPCASAGNPAPRVRAIMACPLRARPAGQHRGAHSHSRTGPIHRLTRRQAG